MDQSKAKEVQQDQSSLPKKDFQYTHATKDKVEACKQYIERKYARQIQEEKEKKISWELMIQKMNELNLNMQEKESIKKQVLHKEAEYLRKKYLNKKLIFTIRRNRMSANDFEPLKIIGRGAFGEVRICKDKLTGEIVAVKKMKKHEMLSKNQIAHVRAERDILVQSDIPWIVELKYSFQDDKYLYLVMEYLAGGDLMTLLMKKDILSEEDSKFYIAELIISVDAIHKMNFIHRDLKPDNVLIDSEGHLKLSDFGLCKHTEIKPRMDLGRKNINDIPYKFDPSIILTKRPQNFKRNRQLAFSTVGTPDYIAPEVFSQQGYTETVDWWSVGVMLFEMVVGYPPFFSDDPQTTCHKILHWKKTFQIPQDANLSLGCSDLIRRLIADPNERLGINGVQEIKAHPFFFGIDWRRIREKVSPYVPEIKSNIDTDNFEQFQEEDTWYVPEGKKSRRKANFHGYSWKKADERERSPIQIVMDDLENMKPILRVEKKVSLKLSQEKRPISNNNPNRSIQQVNRLSVLQQEPKNSQVPKTNQQQVAYNYNIYHNGAKSNSPSNKQSICINNQKDHKINPPLICYYLQEYPTTLNQQQRSRGVQENLKVNIPRLTLIVTPTNAQANQLIQMLSQLNSQQQVNSQRAFLQKPLNTSTTKNGSQIIFNKINANSNKNYLLAQATINHQGISKPGIKKGLGGLPNLNTQGSPKAGNVNQFASPYQPNLHKQGFQYGLGKEREGSPRSKGYN